MPSETAAVQTKLHLEKEYRETKHQVPAQAQPLEREDELSYIDYDRAANSGENDSLMKYVSNYYESYDRQVKEQQAKSKRERE